MKHHTPGFLKERIQTVLAAAQGLKNRGITAQYGFEERRVGKWRKRWANAHNHWKASDCDLRPTMSASLVLLWLSVLFQLLISKRCYGEGLGA
jgi:hypothetical protein